MKRQKKGAGSARKFRKMLNEDGKKINPGKIHYIKLVFSLINGLTISPIYGFTKKRVFSPRH